MLLNFKNPNPVVWGLKGALIGVKDSSCSSFFSLVSIYLTAISAFEVNVDYESFAWGLKVNLGDSWN